MSKQALLVFAKNPEAGKVKTRLAATMGNEAALAVYNQILTYTVSVTQYLPVDKFVYYSNYIGQEDIWNSEHYYKEIQQGADLGERMKNAFASTFIKGYDKVVIIGTDCPGISEDIIRDAFGHLQRCDVAIGPAKDGGYYLLGMRQLHSKLFENIQWSTNTVLNDTIKKCNELHLTYHLSPVLIDIDEEKDLEECKIQKQ